MPTDQRVKSLGKFVAQTTIDRIGVTFKIDIHVIPGDLDVILLKEPFLINEEVKVDFRDAIICIAGRVLFLDKYAADH